MPSGVGEGKSFIISSLFRLSGLLRRGGLALSWLLVCAHVMTCWRMSSSVHSSLGAAKSPPEDCTNGQNYQWVGGLQPPLASNSLVSAQQWARGRRNLSLSSERKRFLSFMLHFLCFVSHVQEVWIYSFKKFLSKPQSGTKQSFWREVVDWRVGGDVHFRLTKFPGPWCWLAG